jgi:homoaconitate hydratase family protein
MGRTITEKILATHTTEGRVEPGEIIQAKVDLIMVHEVLGSRIIPVLEQMDFKKVWDPDRVLVVNDHWAPPPDIESAQIHMRNRQFVKEQGITHFCDVDCGICHQVLAEKGLVAPGDLIIGSDSHSTTYGAFNAFSTGLAATDSALILATGECWFRVPEPRRIEVNGALGHRIMSKDLVLKIIHDLGSDGANYQAMEFFGSTIDTMSVGSRMTICNMSVEAGAKNCVMEVNSAVESWLEARALGREVSPVTADHDAAYVDSMTIDLDDEPIEPLVALPHSPANGVPVREASGIKIDQAFIGSCTNGRLEDLEAACEILRRKKIHKDVRLIVTPASRETYLEALRTGIVEALMQAGAIVTNSTCGACVGGHLGVLGPGEVCISSTNRNFMGRMGHRDSKIYLASPATVAASAIKGEIADPREV